MTTDEHRDDETLEEDVEETEEVEDEESESEEESKEDTPDWEAEAKKWKAIAQRTKKKQPLKTKAEPEADDIKADVAYLKQSEKKRQFGYEHSLSPEETDKIFQLNPNPTADTLKDPFVKAGLEAIRRNKRVEDNTPSSSAKSNPISSKKFKDLPAHEKDAKLQEFVKAKYSG